MSNRPCGPDYSGSQIHQYTAAQTPLQKFNIIHISILFRATHIRLKLEQRATEGQGFGSDPTGAYLDIPYELEIATCVVNDSVEFVHHDLKECLLTLYTHSQIHLKKSFIPMSTTYYRPVRGERNTPIFDPL